MFKRLSGPPDDPIDAPPHMRYSHALSVDEKTLLALVAAMLYTKEDSPVSAVDRAAALIREVNTR